MRILVSRFVVLLVFVWLVGFFVLDAGSSIHILLISAIAIVFLNTTRGANRQNNLTKGKLI